MKSILVVNLCVAVALLHVVSSAPRPQPPPPAGQPPPPPPAGRGGPPPPQPALEAGPNGARPHEDENKTDCTGKPDKPPRDQVTDASGLLVRGGARPPPPPPPRRRSKRHAGEDGRRPGPGGRGRPGDKDGVTRGPFEHDSVTGRHDSSDEDDHTGRPHHDGPGGDHVKDGPGGRDGRGGPHPRG